jgi:hypothetical protein
MLDLDATPDPDDPTEEEVRELAKTTPGIERFYGVEPDDSDIMEGSEFDGPNPG